MDARARAQRGIQDRREARERERARGAHQAAQAAARSAQQAMVAVDRAYRAQRHADLDDSEADEDARIEVDFAVSDAVAARQRAESYARQANVQAVRGEALACSRLAYCAAGAAREAEQAAVRAEQAAS